MGAIHIKKNLSFDDEDMKVNEDSPVVINEPRYQRTSELISERNIAISNSDFKVAQPKYSSVRTIPIDELQFMEFIQLIDVTNELTFRDNSIASLPGDSQTVQQAMFKTNQKSL